MTLLELIHETRTALREIRHAAQLIVAHHGRALTPGEAAKFQEKLEKKQRHIDMLQNSHNHRAMAAEAEVARLTKELESVHESYRGVVQRRQWREVGDERWRELLAVNARVLLSGGDYPCCAAFVVWCNDDRTHYCEIAAP